MPQMQTRRTPVRLSFRDGEVMVTHEDQDIFFINAAKATEACQAAIRDEERVARFRTELLLPLAQWCELHKDRISACYLVPPESTVIPVYMVGATEQYDFTLTEQLTSLVFAFADQQWSVHISQIPRCDAEELAAFFNPHYALQIYG